MNNKLTCLACLALSCLLFGGTLAAQTGTASFASMTYEEFSRLDIDARRAVFVEMGPSKKAEMIRAHIRSWRNQNRSNLAPAQLDLLEQLIRVVDAKLYDGSSNTKAKAELENLFFVAKDSLSEAQISELFYLTTPRSR